MSDFSDNSVIAIYCDDRADAKIAAWAAKFLLKRNIVCVCDSADIFANASNIIVFLIGAPILSSAIMKGITAAKCVHVFDNMVPNHIVTALLHTYSYANIISHIDVTMSITAKLYTHLNNNSPRPWFIDVMCGTKIRNYDGAALLRAIEVQRLYELSNLDTLMMFYDDNTLTINEYIITILDELEYDGKRFITCDNYNCTNAAIRATICVFTRRDGTKQRTALLSMNAHDGRANAVGNIILNNFKCDFAILWHYDFRQNLWMCRAVSATEEPLRALKADLGAYGVNMDESAIIAGNITKWLNFAIDGRAGASIRTYFCAEA